MHTLTVNEIQELFLNKIDKNFYHVSLEIFDDFDYNITIYRRYFIKDRDGRLIRLDTAYWTTNSKKVLDSTLCSDAEMFAILRKTIEKKY